MSYPQVTTTEEECLKIRSFHVTGRNSGLKVSADIGAALSITTHNNTQLCRQTSTLAYQDANKIKIVTFGQKTLTLDFWLNAISLVVHRSLF